ncbi:hypothetical protein PTTG_28136 [Puccinia triticina 1-1 BBBD Race 1]|uniref:Uncharacterized protein n=1 Tax=Puccinia triticina (isolate 1-1 / race 1 (BBBD)) TaxID=630390 RepID=A0A180GF53_PUCT1|nr:hypothetical protein PTTG_28136 [Puccinia triticina 1-1 BBBD Race 1]
MSSSSQSNDEAQNSRQTPQQASRAESRSSSRSALNHSNARRHRASRGAPYAPPLRGSQANPDRTQGLADGPARPGKPLPFEVDEEHLSENFTDNMGRTYNLRAPYTEFSKELIQIPRPRQYAILLYSILSVRQSVESLIHSRDMALLATPTAASLFTFYLKRHDLQDLLSRKWIKDEKNSKTYNKKNNKALDALYGAVSKELHNEILENDTSFLDAWDALASACGQNSVITTCTAYKKVHSMKYQPGTSLTDHITAFKSAYTRLSDITANHLQEFGTVTSFMAAALFLDSLENDSDMAPLIQTCYDIQPFNLKNVTDQSQDNVMFASSSNPSSKSNKKKSKSSNGPKPKAVAPTLNNASQTSASKGKTLNMPSSAKSTSSDSVENRIQKIEQSVSDLTDLMKKFV